MAYKLTPEQYKDAAINRISNKNTAENTNSAVSAYARALNGRRALDNKNLTAIRKNQTVNMEREDDEQSSGDWFSRTVSTVVAPVLRFTEGAAKFVENAIFDSVSGLTAGALDLFGADSAAKRVQSFAAKDVVGETFDWEPIQEIYENSWSNEWGKFGEILQEGIYSVGNQAIPFALNFVPGIGPALSKISFALGAYGGSFESASQDGGSVLGANAYGLASAGVESLIESAGGFVPGKKSGGNQLDDVIAKVAKKESVKKALSFFGDMATEGGEELISGMVENYLQAMTYKGDYSSVQSYVNNILTADPATQEELIEQFLVGAVSGGLMGGAQIGVRKASVTVDSSEYIREIEDLKQKGYNLNRRGKDTTATEAEIARTEESLVKRINAKFDKLKAKRKNGNSVDQILSYMEKNFNVGEDGKFTSSKSTLVRSENASYGVTDGDIERSVTKRGNTLHTGVFEGKALESKRTVESALNGINNRLRRNRLNLIVADFNTDSKTEMDFGYLDGNNVVINAKAFGENVDFTVLENGVAKKCSVDGAISTLLHEVFHFSDDTKAGNKLKNLLFAYGAFESFKAEKAGVKDANLLEEVRKSYPNANDGTIVSELSARQLENLLFNEKVIERLTEDNSTLAKRILNKAKYLLDAIKGEKIASTKNLEILLKKTVKLYNKAIAQKGNGKTIYAKRLDKEEEREDNKDIEYSRRLEDGREESGAIGSKSKEVKLQDRDNGRRRVVPVFNDGQRTRRISEIIGDGETIRKVGAFAEDVYIQAKTEPQESLQWHAKNEGINLFFVKRKSQT
ncbi:MAG: hypothetical protein IIX01_01440, partial [Clostridia bacterium]|nr:hypothetical protein [Clostridia bacterium]